MQTLEQLVSGQLMGTKKLKLSCALTTFPPEILDLADTLEVLDLSGNLLSELPEDFVRLQNLKIAFFSDNNFTLFPEVLSRCPRLEMIGFKANKIAFIAEGSFPPELRWLILTNNHLTSLPKSTGQCRKLQKLMLAGNHLQKLPREMAACQKLELLRISANNFAQIPKWLFSLPRLSWLAYAGNPCSWLAMSDNSLARIRWKELVIQQQLGEGASGNIAKAQWQDPRSNGGPKEVAVKIFKGEVTSDGLPADEMSACIAAGTHHNLVKILTKISEHPTQKQGLVFDLIPASFRNLGNPPSFETCTRDVYSDETIFSVDQIIKIASGIASVAAHLHSSGIMHGDLYAHNIMVNEAAHALLGDFGAATIYHTGDKKIADALERIEVRAFGCLLEDLLTHADLKDMNHAAIKALNQLKHACLQDKAAQRPAFGTIGKLLQAMGSDEVKREIAAI